MAYLLTSPCAKAVKRHVQEFKDKKIKRDDNIDHIQASIKQKIEEIVARSAENETIDEFVTDKGLVSIQPLKSALDQQLLRSMSIKEIRGIVRLAIGKFKTS